MTEIEIRGLAHIRELFGASRFKYHFKGTLDIYGLLDVLDLEYDLGKYIYDDHKEFIDDIRILLRGRDIKFLPKEQLILKQDDIVLVMPRLAGG